MDWNALKGQLEAAVRTEAVKAIDQAIERLQQLRAEYTEFEAPERPTPPLVEPGPPRTVTTSPVNLPTSATSGTEPPAASTPKRRGIPRRNCIVCRQEYQPAGNAQKKCADCRAAAVAQSAGDSRERPAGAQYDPTTPEENEWKEYGERVAAKLSQRSDAPVLPGRA